MKSASQVLSQHTGTGMGSGRCVLGHSLSFCYILRPVTATPLSLSLPVPSLGQRSLANLAWYSCPPGTDAHWGLGLALTVPPQGSVSHTEHCHSFTTDRTRGNTTKRGLTVPAGR